MRIKTGDLVKVINGKEKGKTGEVLKTIPLENRVVVKGINLRTKHVKPTQEGETGRILTEEASLHASNVMFFSKNKNLTSKIEYFIDNLLYCPSFMSAKRPSFSDFYSIT